MILQPPQDPEMTWLRVLTILAGPLTGVITALAVTYLTDRKARERDALKYRIEREEALRKEAVVRREATRLEHLKRDLQALESFTSAAVGMQAELGNATSAGLSGSWDRWEQAFDHEPSLRAAMALSAIYFPYDFVAQWLRYRAQYSVCREAITKLAHVRIDMEKLEAQDENRATIYAALDAANAEVIASMNLVSDRLDKLLSRIAEVAQEKRHLAEVAPDTST